MSEGAGFETRAIHVGQEPDPVTGAVVTPISLATTFRQDEVGKHGGFEYARGHSPVMVLIPVGLLVGCVLETTVGSARPVAWLAIPMLVLVLASQALRTRMTRT